MVGMGGVWEIVTGAMPRHGKERDSIVHRGFEGPGQEGDRADHKREKKKSFRGYWGNYLTAAITVMGFRGTMGRRVNPKEFRGGNQTRVPG